MHAPDSGRLRSLYERAIALPPAERTAFLAEACGGDAELLAKLQSMLRAGEDVGASIGPYRLLQQLGEGGFGVVFLAEQSEPVARQVALKLLKLGMDSRQIVARFAQERQALALMDHPNIARVLDAGVTATGRPFFVMDLVRGLPIVDYCDRNQLPVAERLTIFAQVCDAIQHAHGKGLIHRDLKPSNVLVALQDGRPQPKVIDFGVAKAIQRPLTDATLFTEQEQVVGTLLYMSPEQAAGSLDIDTRTDVYALGILLYELLTGSAPFAGGDSLSELQRRIREVDPPRPSQRASQVTGQPAVAARRRCAPQQLVSQLRGELDWIAMKAIEKDRTRRYETASALAADVRRHLRGEAITAAPPSTGYRVRKFVRRNRGLVFAGAAVALTLLLGVVGTTTMLLSAIAERERADAATAAAGRAKAAAEDNERLARAAAASATTAQAEEARARRRAETIRDFVVTSLRASDADQGGRDDATILGALDGALADVEQRFGDDPETAADLKNTIASILRNNGRAEQALAQAEQALALRQRLHPGDHDDVAESLNDAGRACDQLGRHADAERYLRQSLEMYERLHAGDNVHTAALHNNLGDQLRQLQRYDEAEQHLRAAAAMHGRLFHGDNAAMAGILDNLGKLMAARGRFADATDLTAQSLAMRQRLDKRDRPDLAVALNNLGVACAQNGDNDRALPLLEQALAMRQRLYHGDHPVVAESMANVAFLKTRLDRGAEALPLLEQALAMNQRLHPGDDAVTAHTLYALANTRLTLGDAAAARPTAEEAAAMHQRLFPGDHLGTAVSLLVLARCEAALGEAATARPHFDAALAMQRRLPEAAPVLRDTLWHSSRARIALHDYAGAVAELEELAALAAAANVLATRQQEIREALDQCRQALHAGGR